jgi:dienelactone hydrolase
MHGYIPICRKKKHPLTHVVVGIHFFLFGQPFGGLPPTAPTLTSKITTPIYLISCANDPPFVKPGGSTITELLQTSPRSKAYEFATMQHGFVNRGDVDNDETVRANVKLAIEMTSEFFLEVSS